MAIPPTISDLRRRKAAQFQKFYRSESRKSFGFRNNSKNRVIIGNINNGYKSHYTGTYPNGTATDRLLFPSHYTNYWEAVTCNNPFKWRPNQSTASQANSGTFNFNISGAADYVYNYTIDNGMKFFYHNLLWGANQGYPEWFDGLSEADSKIAFNNWLSAIQNKYTGIAGINVLNEIAPGHQDSGTTILRNQLGGNGSTGHDWVIYVFERAKYYFPNSKRYINDYGILSNSSTRQYIIDVAKILKERDLISGIGIQAHYFNVDRLSSQEINNALDDIKNQVDLPIYITELDITGHEYTNGAYVTGAFSEDLQLERFKTIFPTLYKHPSVERITLWGYIIGETWRYDSQNIDTGLINRDGTGKRKALEWLEENYL